MGPVPSLGVAGIRRTEERERERGFGDEKFVGKGCFVGKEKWRRENRKL